MVKAERPMVRHPLSHPSRTVDDGLREPFSRCTAPAGKPEQRLFYTFSY